jgi:hypothetical protein
MPLSRRLIDGASLVLSVFICVHACGASSNRQPGNHLWPFFFSSIVKLQHSARDDAFKKLIILAGLRKLKDTILTEVKHMPILNDIMDHGIIGPAIRQGVQQGVQQGGQQGVQQGELTILRRLILKRFGPLPAWADERLPTLSTAELEDLSLRLLEAQNLDELFSR